MLNDVGAYCKIEPYWYRKRKEYLQILLKRSIVLSEYSLPTSVYLRANTMKLGIGTNISRKSKKYQIHVDMANSGTSFPPP